MLGEFHAREGVFKRYFPVILKPIILTLLFLVTIVWIYLALSAVSPVWFLDPTLPPEVKAEETARASNLGSFLMNLFQGNFGYSFRTGTPVWNELAWRFPTTFLLVGLSTLFSVLIGMGLSMLFKPGKRKPSTFAHSLRGFFFGLVPLIAIPLMLFFCYYMHLWFGFSFPLRGLHSVPPPTDPLSYVSDMLWHLFLPVATLTLIGVVRILLAIWSSGSTFTERALPKKILLPCTTIDFTVMVSAVIIVEWFWTMPGVGRLLLNSLLSADYNALVGSFVMILVLAVGLGYVSVLLDFIQRLTGLHEDLEKKVTAESKINPTQTKEVSGKSIKFFLRRKALVIGSAIVIVFLMLALSAPFITPYDPLYTRRLAEGFAMPGWVTIFPENADLPRTMENSLYWSISQGSELVRLLPGKEVVAEYEAGTELLRTDVDLTSNFTYPYSPPHSFNFDFRWTAENVKDVRYHLQLFLIGPQGNITRLFPDPLSNLPAEVERTRLVHTESTDFWLVEGLGYEPGVDNLAEIVFSEKGPYSLLLRISFSPKSLGATCRMTVEDAKFTIPGLVHGILGTDNVGLDLFSQLVYGARTAVILAFPTAFLAVILGFQFGFLAGYFQGWADNVTTPVVDTLLCLPILPILLITVFLYGKSAIFISLSSLLLFFALATKAFRNTFLVRPSNQKFKGNASAKKVLNVFKDLVANFCLTAISLILLLTIIEFLGFGDPTVHTWGRMLYAAFGFGAFAKLAWWWILPPVFCIAFFALGLLLVGTGLEDENAC